MSMSKVERQFSAQISRFVRKLCVDTRGRGPSIEGAGLSVNHKARS